MKQVIDGILDTLLVIGAIACILTIGGGSWLAGGAGSGDPGSLVPYPPEIPQMQNQPGLGGSPLLPVTGGAAAGGAAAEQEDPCPPPVAGDMEQADAYLYRYYYEQQLVGQVAAGSGGMGSSNCP